MIEQWLQRVWYEKGGRPPVVLRLLSSVYGVALQTRRLAFRRGWLRRGELPVPVAVVGNMVVGGTGKTPLVIHLAQLLRGRGRHIGIITRGYRSPAEREGMVLLPGEPADPALVGDEAALLVEATEVPVAVGADRIASAHALLRSDPEIELLLADDGLQNLRLPQDLTIEVRDERGEGNAYLLPAGPIREPALRSHDFVLRRNKDFWLEIQQTRNLATGEVCALAKWQGMVVHAAAGIGNPQQFFDQLAASGVEVRGHHFPDHHRFERGDFDALGEGPILMTEKDAVKCRAFADARMWATPAVVRMPEETEVALLEELESLVR